jgi:hypothetical protein
MADFSDFAEAALLDFIFRGTAPATIPTAVSGNWGVALCTAEPTEAGTLNEVDTGDWTDYARQDVLRHTTGWAAATSEGGGGQLSDNAGLIDFGTATVPGADVDITHAAIVDGSGNWWMRAALPATKTVQNGDPVSIAIGALDFILR